MAVPKSVSNVQQLKKVLNETIDGMFGPLSALVQERDALKRALDGELEGNLELRKKYGAREDETFHMFVERLYTQADKLNGLLSDVRWKYQEGQAKIKELDRARAENRAEINHLKELIERYGLGDGKTPEPPKGAPFIQIERDSEKSRIFALDAKGDVWVYGTGHDDLSDGRWYRLGSEKVD